MPRYLLRRLAQAALVVLGVVVISFLIARKIPGDAAVSAEGARASEAQLEAARERLGLDQPLPVQLWHYLQGLLQGDLGVSLSTRQPVTSDLGRALPASLELVGASMVLAVLVGIPLGVLAARYKRGPVDTSVRLSSVLLVSFPVFLLGLLVQLTFATRLGWFPTASEYDRALDQSSPLTVYTNLTVVDALITGNWPILLSTLHHLVLPAVVLAAYPIGAVAQMTRAALIEESTQDHARMERAMGFGRLAVLVRFSLRPAIGPVLSLLALVFAYALVNSFLVEAIFNWPGMGSYTAAAIRSVDAPAIAGVTLVVALVYVVLNLLVDLLQALVDPRVRAA
ncbi:ABC transporter permease [Nocardioides sp. GY 10113]|uniref:ABC transporter permease n=1 Tax=Nocardioides sp. GY 10113 TaxID=2569761 RepID=UPI0010A7A8E9|nr:ABC transporter permease [Nocardioides sp. GY 10113]TIC88620.1 ABC transporter permease [Nocardioides sp. GY 10113]